GGLDHVAAGNRSFLRIWIAFCAHAVSPLTAKIAREGISSDGFPSFRALLLRRGQVPDDVRTDVRALLPLPRLSAPDRQRLCAERADRSRSRRVARQRDARLSAADGQRKTACHPPLSRLRHCDVEHL